LPLHEFVSLFLLLGGFLLLCRLSTPPHLLISFVSGTMADFNFSASTQVAREFPPSGDFSLGIARESASPCEAESDTNCADAHN